MHTITIYIYISIHSININISIYPFSININISIYPFNQYQYLYISLSLPLASLGLAILDLTHYNKLMSFLNFETRKTVAFNIVNSLLNSKASLDSPEKVSFMCYLLLFHKLDFKAIFLFDCSLNIVCYK